jgi:hypothetical protein
MATAWKSLYRDWTTKIGLFATDNEDATSEEETISTPRQPAKSPTQSQTASGRATIHHKRLSTDEMVVIFESYKRRISDGMLTKQVHEDIFEKVCSFLTGRISLIKPSTERILYEPGLTTCPIGDTSETGLPWTPMMMNP